MHQQIILKIYTTWVLNIELVRFLHMVYFPVKHYVSSKHFNWLYYWDTFREEITVVNERALAM